MKAFQFKKLERTLYCFLKDYCELKNSRPKIRRKSAQESVVETHEFLKELISHQINTPPFRNNTLPLDFIHTQGSLFEIIDNTLIHFHNANEELESLEPLAIYLLQRKHEFFETLIHNINLPQKIIYNHMIDKIQIIYSILYYDEKSRKLWLYIFDLNFKNRHATIPFDSSKGKKLDKNKFQKIYNNLDSKQIYIFENEFAKQLNLGIHEFRRQFKEYALCTLFQYHSTRRMNKALTMFYFSDKRPDEIADELGYTIDELRSAFRTHFGTSYTKVTRLK